MWSKIYRVGARIICGICHGKCCRKTKTFQRIKITKNGETRTFLKDLEIYGGKSCASYNPRTGLCTCYDERMALCVYWKCGMLNLWSRMCGEQVWTGEWKWDIEPEEKCGDFDKF